MVKLSKLFVASLACTALGLEAEATVVASENSSPAVVYINAMEAMQTSKHGQKRLAELKKKENDLASSLKKKENDLTVSLKKKQEKLTQDVKDYEAKEKTMSATAKEKAESNLFKGREELEVAAKTSQQELEVAAKTSQQELQLVSTRATEELSKDIEQAAAEIGKKEKCDAVVDLFTGRVVWANDQTVKTKEIVKVMDKNYETKLASSKAPKAPTTVAVANRQGAAAA